MTRELGRWTIAPYLYLIAEKREWGASNVFLCSAPALGGALPGDDENFDGIAPFRVFVPLRKANGGDNAHT
jgi:hypothetical protein